ncbi:methyltransferase domain-containing protein [Pseudoroseicyclus sp. H15]
MSLTDRTALARQRSRAARAPALFLQEEAANDVQERVAEVNRAFTSPAVVTPWPELWAARMPGAKLIPDGETLDLTEGSHDLVIHALSLHWADDPLGQIIQCARALKPDGLFIASFFGGETLAPLRAALAEAEAAVTGGASPRVLPMAEVRQAGALLQRAGLALPVADLTPFTVSYSDPLALMRDLRAMGEGNALAQRLRQPTRREVIARAAALMQQDADDEGRITARFEMITLTAWSPGPGQQQPMRPGSATTRLEDALRAAREEGGKD